LALFSQKKVAWTNVRMYAAWVEPKPGQGWPRREVCFLEKTGKTYRFVQVCWADAHLQKMEGCDIGWITSQPSFMDLYD
jgi:hypothetical protein